MRTVPFRWLALGLALAAAGYAGSAGHAAGASRWAGASDRSLPRRDRPAPSEGPVLPLAAQAPSPLPAQGAPLATRERTIAVTGEGSVNAVPDRATVALSVIVLRPTAQEAQQQSAATMTQIVGKIMAAGIPQADIRTTAVSLEPQRRPESGYAGPITGYQSINRVLVAVDDISRVGRVIDAGVAAGANGVDSLTWDLRDATPYRAQAVRLAVQNARETANAIAEAAGVAGLRLLRIEQVQPITYPRPGIAMAQAAPVTPALPGTVRVSVQVRAIYGF